MTMTNSFLARMIDDFRMYTGEPTLNAKYIDATLIAMIEQSYAIIINEINRLKTEPFVARYNVTYVTDTETYLLPGLMGSIYAIYYLTDSDYKLFYDSRSGYNPYGRRVWVEGYTLHIQDNILSNGDVITVEYFPSGTARLHNGSCTVDSTGKLVTFGASPTDGTLDTHANAYAGCIFRLLTHSTGTWDYIQERNILSYVNSTRIATLDVALDPNPESNATTSYEIAPAISRGLDHVVALYLAMWVSAIEGNTTRAGMLRRMYRDSIRNLRLTTFYSNLQEAPKWRADTYKNERFLYRRLWNG